MDDFVRQLDWATGCPDSWLNVTLSVSVMIDRTCKEAVGKLYQASKKKVLQGADILTSSYLAPQIEFQWPTLAVSPLPTGFSSLAAHLSETAYVFDDRKGFRSGKLRCVLFVDMPRRWWWVKAVKQGGLGFELCRHVPWPPFPHLWCKRCEPTLPAWFEHHTR